jgi:hypothetical protein
VEDRLKIRQPIQHKDTLGEFVGVTHLADRLLVVPFAQCFEAPMAHHTGVQEVPVDRRELVEEHLVERGDDGWRCWHSGPPPYALRAA